MIATLRNFTPGDERAAFRTEDEDECRASGGSSCAESIMETHRHGGEVRVLLSPRTGDPFIFFGMNEYDEDSGLVWMLATPEISRSARSVLHWTPQVLTGWHQCRPLLFNYVDARNELHIRWLKRIGFNFLRLVPAFGAEQRPFYEFARLSHV